MSSRRDERARVPGVSSIEITESSRVGHGARRALRTGKSALMR
jgi:hypothetical protein